MIASQFLLLLTIMGAPSHTGPSWKYPATATVDASDTHFGITYPDPYRWLEDGGDSSREWFNANAKLTDQTLAQIPGRASLLKEWLELDKLTPSVVSDIGVSGGRVFYRKATANDNVAKLYCRESWTGAERLLLDPTDYQPGKTTTLRAAVPSWNGKFVAVALTSGGFELSEIRVLDVERGTMLPDVLKGSYGPLGWTPDGRAFFYDAGSETLAKNANVMLDRQTRVHTLGAEVSTDRTVFSRGNNKELGLLPMEFPHAGIDEGSPDYLLGTAGTVQSERRIFWAATSDLKKKRINWKPLCDRSDNLVRGFELVGDQVYAITHTNAPRMKVVRTGLKRPAWKTAQTVLAEASDSIQSMVRSKNYLWVIYTNGISGRLVRVDLATLKSVEMKLPVIGTVSAWTPDVRSDRLLVQVSSWLAPVALYELEGAQGSFTRSVFDDAVTYPGFDQLMTEEVEVPGHDGELVPLSIIRRKDLALDGSHSAILDGYGSYGISTTPRFSVLHSVASRGVVVAIAHPRGGREKGERWYRGGYKATKPNTWKDFLSAAEYLIQKGYTRAPKLAGTGMSAGGITISRAITERPELFGAALCNVGTANMLRHEFSPQGPVNIPEFGTVTIESEAKALAEMDGVLHVRKGVSYPAVLGVAGWNDPRVPPWQPGKFIAALQAATTSGKPALLKVNYGGGHFSAEKAQTFENFAGIYAFLLWQTGHPDFQPTSPRGPPSLGD